MFADELPQLDILSIVDEGVARIAITGDLDSASAPRLIATIHELAQAPVRSIEVDCRGVQFMDSAGIRALIVGRNRANGVGIGFTLVEQSSQVRRILDMTGLGVLLTN